MRRSVLWNTGIVLGIFFCVFCVLFFSSVHIREARADTLPQGTRPATAADLGWMQAAGIPNPVVGMPVNPNNASLGQVAGEAKIWLSQHATKDSNIGCLDPQFAEKLKTFMMSVPGGIPTIVSAYRPPEAQAALVSSGASKAGACQSYHNYGLAADFNNNTAQQTQWMRANSASFGIGHIGDWDPNHFQDGGGIHGQCGACSGGYSGTQPSQGVQQPMLPPQQQMASQPQNPFAPPQPQQCQPGYVLLNGSCLPPQATTATQTASPYTYVSPPTSSTTNINTNTNVSNIIDSNDSSATGTSDSAFDLINAIANPTTTSANPAVAAATGTPVALGSSLSDASALHGTNVSAAGTPPGNSVYSLSPEASQTFVSPDLSQEPTQYALQPVNSTFALLDNLKQVLLSILSFLRPFGGIVPNTSANSASAYME